MANLYYHISVETKSNGSKKVEPKYELDKTDRQEIFDAFVYPYLKNESFFINGYQVNQSQISRFVIKTSEKLTETIVDEKYNRLPPNVFVVITREGTLEDDHYMKNITREIISEAKNKMNENESQSIKPISSTQKQYQKVFIVHGHDAAAKEETARFIEKLGLEAIILSEQESLGKTIIEKIESYSDVGFALVLYTPCDVGKLKDVAPTQEMKPRARQNVVWEHGYFIGKLGRERVLALYKEGVELPNDLSGVVYVSMDNHGAWKFKAAKEMKSVGYNIDMNNIQL
jgi:predicted nucleotide-binding protein